MSTEYSKETVLAHIFKKLENENKKSFGIAFSHEALTQVATECLFIERKRKFGSIPTQKGVEYVNMNWQRYQNENAAGSEMNRLQNQIAKLQQRQAELRTKAA
jgi:hypothetical protein